MKEVAINLNRPLTTILMSILTSWMYTKTIFSCVNIELFSCTNGMGRILI